MKIDTKIFVVVVVGIFLLNQDKVNEKEDKQKESQVILYDDKGEGKPLLDTDKYEGKTTMTFEDPDSEEELVWVWNDSDGNTNISLKSYGDYKLAEEEKEETLKIDYSQPYEYHKWVTEPDSIKSVTRRKEIPDGFKPIIPVRLETTGTQQILQVLYQDEFGNSIWAPLPGGLSW